MTFEVDPKEQVEFCLGEWARPRGAFWSEGKTQAKAWRHRDAGHTWVHERFCIIGLSSVCQEETDLM